VSMIKYDYSFYPYYDSALNRVALGLSLDDEEAEEAYSYAIEALLRAISKIDSKQHLNYEDIVHKNTYQEAIERLYQVHTYLREAKINYEYD
jgi:hypothetical protein